MRRELASEWMLGTGLSLSLIVGVVSGCDPQSLAIGSNDGGPDGPGACHQVFVRASLPPVSPQSHHVTTADLNGDQVPDLVVASRSEGVGVLLGHGDGTFAAEVTYNVGQIDSVAVADFDRDGRPDVAAADDGTGLVTILLGSGGGALGAPTTYPAGHSPWSIQAADLNGDQMPDLAVTNIFGTDATVTVLLGKGDGTFSPRASYMTDAGPDGVAIADLDGDGKLDLAVANQAGRSVSVLMGRGDGTFGTQTSTASDGGPTTIVAGDLDGDGRPDLVVADQETNRVGVFRNKGDGTMEIERTLDVLASPYGVAIGDLDRDGKPDIVATNGQSGNVSVLFGNGDASFRPQQSFEIDSVSGTYPLAVAIDDFNGDHRPDMVIARSQVNSASVLLGDCRP